MSLSLSGVIADVEAAIGDAPKALPALQLLVKVAGEVKPLLPAADQAYVTDGEAILNGLISVLSKV
jgi:hypothetical protein